MLVTKEVRGSREGGVALAAYSRYSCRLSVASRTNSTTTGLSALGASTERVTVVLSLLGRMLPVPVAVLPSVTPLE